ncbi:HipA family kinase [Sphingomonas sp. RT2P30]|uniref:HipA family kinase n=1 Tax=Parasphingomonas halimpatiens TaxID=3096162 RepID=UPI002FCACC0B
MDEGGLIPALYGLSVAATRCEQADFGSADCALICRCEDGSDYAIKDSVKNAAMPHSEWLCTRLSEAAGIASPTCKIVSVEGDRWFGSRWETGHNPKDWWLRAISGDIDFALLAPTISRIFAFDLFVHNVDRHLNNYIVREQHFGISILSFDFSRAWLCNGDELPPLPMSPSENTIGAMRFLRQQFGEFIIKDEVDAVLDNLSLIALEQISGFINESPNEWLTLDQKSWIDNWWVSGARLDRIEGIREGIENGTYL